MSPLPSRKTIVLPVAAVAAVIVALFAFPVIEPALVAKVAVAALPEVFWLPEVFTPGRSMLAVPLNETPPMFLAVCRAVAVAALPEVEPDVVADVAVDALPFRAAVIVPALKLPEPSRRTIWLAVFALVAVMVALLAWPEIVPAVVAVVALPDKAAVITPALKLPEASRATTLEAVFVVVASTVHVCAPEPL